MQIGCDAFHLSVYGSDNGILMEVDARGRTLISGQVSPESLRDGKFHNQQIDKPESPRQFFLLNAPLEIQAAIRVEESSQELLKKWEEIQELHKKGELEPFDAQSELERLGKGRFQLMDEALEHVIGGSRVVWKLKENLTYLAYTRKQQLEADGVRLLSFQPVKYYRQPDTETEEDTTRNENITNTAIEIQEDIPF